MKIAIYLGWIRHNASGGVESFTRNLLDGFSSIHDDYKYILICSSDNSESFRIYEKDKRFRIIETSIETANLRRSLLFESFELDRLVSKSGADVCFVPSYRMPLLWTRNKYVTVIHDLQSFHFPENFGFIRRVWLQIGAKRAIQNANRVIAISDFVRNDIVKKIGCNSNKLSVILNPILPNWGEEDFSLTSEDVGVEKNNYFYTISALAKNKNLITLLRLINLIKKTSPDGVANKLVISGIGFDQKDADNIDKKTLIDYIDQNNLHDNVTFTGFVSNERRNSLIKNSQFFLFPSIFEGFGMPVVEAMELGAKVITTNSTSLPEVSENKAVYIDDYFNEGKWLDAIISHLKDEKVVYSFPQYNISYVAHQYLKVITGV